MRLAVAGLLLVLLGCARTSLPPRSPAWTEEQKLNACLDLRDHTVDLYADQYLKDHNESLKPVEWRAFRDGWAEELAKKGTFERFERSCFSGITQERYECGMTAPTTDGLVACMRLANR